MIYLLMMLDKLEFVAVLLSFFSGATAIVTLIMSAVANSEKDNPRTYWTKSEISVVTKVKRWALGIFIPFVMIASFVPNSKQAAVIFTVGNTIEYVQGNEKLHELPDKVVNCLDKFISDYLEDNSNKNSK